MFLGPMLSVILQQIKNTGKYQIVREHGYDVGVWHLISVLPLFRLVIPGRLSQTVIS